ncbi:MAG: alpha/beta fold hydrolase [Caldilineaceae bacterium]
MLTDWQQPLAGPDDPRIRHEAIVTNGVALHVAQAGPTDGPLVLLLHGFPTFWYDWRHQIPALVAAGYRVWAPDQRGYNISDKPKSVRSYNLNTLADDVAGLIDAAGVEKATVIGHDWGAGVAWWMAQRHPQRLHRVAILNVPHPSLLLRKIFTSLKQASRSTYAVYFQLPWLPEASMAAGNWSGLSDSVRRTALRGTFGDEEMEHYRTAWNQPGAMTAMLNWYRAAARYLPEVQARRIRVPVMVIWGNRDFALERDLAQESLALCDDGRLFWVQEATHWVHLDVPGVVNRLLLDFLDGDHPDVVPAASAPAAALP